MPALVAGEVAPEIKLPLNEKGQQFSLTEARKKGPVLAAFFKVSCPVCQFAFPYIQRLFAAYGNDKATIIGISQDNARDTEAFAREFGVKFPIALDEVGKYPVSDSYGLTNVPTLFWISPDGKIELSSVGWAKAELEEFNQKLAAANGQPTAKLFRPGENVAEFKPG
jgi:peroxiredoxin